MISYLIMLTRTLDYMSYNQTEPWLGYKTPLGTFAVDLRVQSMNFVTDVCRKVACCIWAIGWWTELSGHGNGNWRTFGRVFIVTALARWWTRYQGFVIRRRYSICVAGQRRRRAGGHDEVIERTSSEWNVGFNSTPKRQFADKQLESDIGIFKSHLPQPYTNHILFYLATVLLTDSSSFSLHSAVRKIWFSERIYLILTTQ